MTYKTKHISTINAYEFEELINDFLKDLTGVIIDIQYELVADTSVQGHRVAMIVYKVEG